MKQSPQLELDGVKADGRRRGAAVGANDGAEVTEVSELLVYCA